MKLFRVRPKYLRHEFPDKYLQLAWSADLELAEPLMVASPLYNLVDGRVMHRKETSWSWEYHDL